MHLRHLLVAGLLLSPNSLRAIVTAGPPDAYLTRLGAGWDGVASLEVTRSTITVGCSGILLPSGLQLLTAAHCVTDSTGIVDVFGLTALFETAGIFDLIDYRSVAVYPGYTGDPLAGNDLAIVTLSRSAPAEADRYPIYRGFDEAGQIGDLAGYGLTGQGRTDIAFPPGQRRVGLNRLDADGSAFHLAGGSSLLLYDFDNGLPQNDGFGLSLGRNDLGEGLDEVFPSFGDSGCPTFLNGQVAGLHSFSFRLGSSDVDGVLNQSFGEFGADVRISAYANWIDARTTVPEPSCLVLVVPALVMLLIRRRPPQALRSSNGWPRFVGELSDQRLLARPCPVFQGATRVTVSRVDFPPHQQAAPVAASVIGWLRMTW